MRVAVVGSINMDLIFRVKRLPLEGETMGALSFSSAGGGKGANQAISCARLGVETYIVGCVGDDPFGSELLERLKAEGIDVSFVRRAGGISTGLAVILLLPDGENSIVISPGANYELEVKDLLSAREALIKASVLLLQLEVPVEIVIEAAKIAKNGGSTVILDPAPAKRLPDEIWKLVDIVLPNEVELRLLTGEEDVLAGGRKLVEMGVKSVIVTLGENGALLINQDGYMSFPAVKVDVVDTTSAGDAFAGGLASALVKGWNIEDAIRFATCAGALACTRLGAQPSLPFLKETLRLYEAMYKG
ncbi:MAG: ribokinase [Synergistetes bacterium]|nr:ribokinase [Synergistota bacterium]